MLSGECSVLFNWLNYECNSLANKYCKRDLLNEFSGSVPIGYLYVD
jgi:hypothetical protein